MKLSSVVDGALAHPGSEHGLHGKLQLQHDILREILAGLTTNHRQKIFADFFEMFSFEVNVCFNADTCFNFVEIFVEVFVSNTKCDLAK